MAALLLRSLSSSPAAIRYCPIPLPRFPPLLAAVCYCLRPRRLPSLVCRISKTAHRQHHWRDGWIVTHPIWVPKQMDQSLPPTLAALLAVPAMTAHPRFAVSPRSASGIEHTFVVISLQGGRRARCRV